MVAVAQRLLAQGAGVHRLHGLQDRLQPLLGRALVGAEDALVLAGEGVAEAVLEQAAGAHDDGRLPVPGEHGHQLAPDRVGEGAGHDALARLGGAVEQAGPGPALAARVPQAVADEVGVEDIGADEPGVVRLQAASPRGIGAGEDGAGHQHAGRLAAHQSGADHALPDLEEVAKLEVALGQGGEALVAREDHAQERAKRLLLLGRRAVSGTHPLLHLPGAEEAAVPDVEAGGGVEAAVRGLGQRLGHPRALGERRELGMLPGTLPVMREVHGGRAPAQHLHRVDQGLGAVVEDVGQHLGRVADVVHGRGGVRVAKEREVGDRVERGEVGAGDGEEARQHEVAVPAGGEVGEAVEDVVRAIAGGGDGAVDGGGEGLEAGGGVEDVHRHAVAFRQERPVPGKAEVGDRLRRSGDEGLDEARVVLHPLDLPHHVVAGAEARQHCV